MSILETLTGLLNSRRQARDLIDELRGRGLVIVEEAAAPSAARLPIEEDKAALAAVALPFAMEHNALLKQVRAQK